MTSIAIEIEELQQVLEEAFPQGVVKVEDLAGDGHHYSLDIQSAEFSGLSRIAQHKLVYARLGSLATSIHALKIRTRAL